MAYLEAVGRCVPEALRELEAIDLHDEAALMAWAERRGFTDPWALKAARQHARLYPDCPGATGWLGAVMPWQWEPVFPPGPSWNPLSGETEAAFRRRVKAYIKALKATPCIARTPEKDSLQPFERLALYQVGNVQLGELAENRNGDDALSLSAISESLRDTARLVGLTLRRGRRGPRRKT